jgi:hypothetical protein
MHQSYLWLIDVRVCAYIYIYIYLYINIYMCVCVCVRERASAATSHGILSALWCMCGVGARLPVVTIQPVATMSGIVADDKVTLASSLIDSRGFF